MRYLNGAGTSWPKPSCVLEAQRAVWAASPDRWSDTLACAHASIAARLGAGDPNRLWLTPGCTSALAVALADLPLGRGDVVVTSRLEHHALVRPVRRLALDRGVEHVMAPYRPGQPVDLDVVAATLRERPVRLVAVTAASNVTGERLPVEDLAALCRAHHVPLLVDAAQIAGLRPLALDTCGADIVTFAGHKGPHGPQGVGGLWITPGLALRSPAAACEPGSGDACALADTPGYCDLGSVNVAGAAGLAAGLDWLAAEDRWARPAALAAQLRDALRRRDEVRVFGDTADAQMNPTVSFVAERIPVADATARFAAHGIVLRGGSHCASVALEAIGAPEGTIRASFGPFNEPDDVAAILDVIDAA